MIGCVAWVFLMLFAGHYLDKFFMDRFNFDLKKHLEVIVIGIVLITTLPVLYKMFFGKKAKFTSGRYLIMSLTAVKRPPGIFHLAVIVAALGYFVDIYDLLLIYHC